MATWDSLSSEIRSQILSYTIPSEVYFDTGHARRHLGFVQVHNPSLPYLLVNKKMYSEVKALVQASKFIACSTDEEDLEICNCRDALIILARVFGSIEFKIIYQDDVKKDTDLTQLLREIEEKCTLECKELFNDVKILETSLTGLSSTRMRYGIQVRKKVVLQLGGCPGRSIHWRG